MKIQYKLIYILCSLLSLLVIFTFRSVPSGQIWKKYNILYVARNADQNAVASVFSDLGIDDYVSLSNQYLPVNLSKHSPEISMMKIEGNDSYIEKRDAFFFDKSQNYMLYYVPVNYKSRLEDAYNHLANKKIKCGLDTNSSYPFLIPFFVIIFAALLFMFAKNKWVYAIGSAFSIVFVLCNPFYSVATALILIHLFLFLLSRLWNREGLFSFFKKQKIFAILFATILLNIIFSTKITALLFIFYAAGLFSALILYKDIEEYLCRKRPFQSIFILPAKRIELFTEKTFFLLPLSILIVLIFLVTSLISSKSNPASKFSKILLPGKASVQSQELPQLEDYYRWNWEIKTAPYRSINSENMAENKDYSKVEFPYYEEENGKIVLKTKTLSFDESFKESAYSDIEELGFNSLENVMKSEGISSKFSYVSLNSYSINFISIIMILICFFILLFIYISSIIKRGLNRNTKKGIRK